MPATQSQSGVTKSPYEPGVYFVRGQTWQVSSLAGDPCLTRQANCNTLAVDSARLSTKNMFPDRRSIRAAEAARHRLLLRSVLGHG